MLNPIKGNELFAYLLLDALAVTEDVETGRDVVLMPGQLATTPEAISDMMDWYLEGVQNDLDSLERKGYIAQEKGVLDGLTVYTVLEAAHV